MRFEQLRSVLQKLAPTFHRQVSDYYLELSEKDISPRVALMLDYLIEHEQKRALALGDFCTDSNKALLDHWFKGIEIEFPQIDSATIDPAAAHDLDLLVKSAANYKQFLIEYYSHLIEKCTEPEVSKLFESLKYQEEKALKRLVRHAQGLADL
jgi:rubrerythrin